jgi:predicted GIY-YIG superfamily endonuclease
MAVKTVTIESSDYIFPTQKEAQRYYSGIVKELFNTNLTLSVGQDFEDLQWIYTAYCGYTDDQLERLKDTEITSFKGVRTVIQNGGQYIHTECCAVIFSNGTEVAFSVEKAIKEIAAKQNPR